MIYILIAIMVWILHPIVWQFFIKSDQLTGASKKIEIIAHRGANNWAPENTISAIKKALELGADAIEVDVHLTKDNQLIIIHDEVLERTTNGTGNVADHTLVDLKQLDAGSWFSEDFKGEQLPTLQEVLKLINNKAMCLIELKWSKGKPYVGIEEKVANEILRQNAVEWVIVQSFESSYLKQMNEYNPEIHLAKLLTGSWQLPIPFYYDYKFHWGAYTPPHYIEQVNFYYKRATPTFINHLHKNGIKAGVFTLNSKSDMIKQGNMHIDCIITNDVELSQQIIKQ